MERRQVLTNVRFEPHASSATPQQDHEASANDDHLTERGVPTVHMQPAMFQTTFGRTLPTRELPDSQGSSPAADIGRDVQVA